MTAQPASPTPEQQIVFLSSLLQLEKRIRHAQTIPELLFCLANETLRLTNYKQALVWEVGLSGGLRLKTISGIDRPERNAPFPAFVNKLLRTSFAKGLPRTPQPLEPEGLDNHLQEAWRTWECGHGLWVPILAPQGNLLGGMLLFRHALWGEQESALFERLADTAGHAWMALYKKAGPLRRTWSSPGRRTLIKLMLLLAFAGIMSLPVHLSAIAPARIVPQNPVIVSPGMEGVVRDILVKPNQQVVEDQPLFSLDDTTLANRLKIGEKEIKVVTAEYTNIQQKAFNDPRAREKILFLKAQLDQKNAELEYIRDLLEKTVVRSPEPGIAIFQEPDAWMGKPVVIGEKVMTVADPDHVELEVMLPADEAIHLAPRADILFFLNIAPEAPLKARLESMSYEPLLTAEGFLAFTIKANLVDQATPPRIGMQGTAKVLGEQVPLIYYLLRRPFTALRTRLGI
ncbi:efflux RND transporter periplasmic adaptor subunit [Desulfoplanes sp.]